MRRSSGWFRRPGRVLAAGLAMCTVAACAPADARETDELRLGYLLNLGHAPAMVGIEHGSFADALGPGVDVEASSFSAGPAVVEALFSGGLDAAYVGPNPALNAYARSDGEAVRVVAGSTSGGAALVVRPGITSPDELAGATLATPQIGNTQDVALRAWLSERGYDASLSGGGEVSIRPQPPAQILETFLTGAVDGAWVPEPWASRMVIEGGGHVLVDESELWPGGRFVTTSLVVRVEFLERRPDLVRRLLEGHLDALDLIAADPAAARRTVGDLIETASGSRLGEDVERAAWGQLTFGADPLRDALRGAADDAIAVGLLEPVDIDGIHDLGLLERLLDERSDAEIVP